MTITAPASSSDASSPSTPELDALRSYVRDLKDLGSAMALLGWDQQTKLPPKGAAGRGRTMGALSTVLHAQRTSDELERLLVAVEEQGSAPDEARVVRRMYDLSTKLPSAFVRDMSEAESAGYSAWHSARERDDFAAFLPHLERLVELSQRAAEYHGYETERYDALHDLYEQGSRASELEPMFAALREPINRLIDRQPEPDTSVLERMWPAAAQETFGRRVVARMGFDFDAGRLDETVHPFCSGIGDGDTRLTTRYDEHWLPCSLFGTIHEAGHGIYDQSFFRLQVPTILADAPGLGMHESQSRMYENVIGRSRPFWSYWYGDLQKMFPEATAGVELDQFLRQINTARRSLIRVEADELTYNLHLAIRFELERALINGDLAPRDLPEAWGDTFERWLGIRPDTDREGCLQDVHWSGGSFGYFPTYTLGNVYAAQFVEACRRDVTDLDAHIERGDFTPLVAWFDEHVYRHGCRYTGRELVQRITGGPVDTAPLVRYLEAKFT